MMWISNDILHEFEALKRFYKIDPIEQVDCADRFDQVLAVDKNLSERS